MQNFCFVRRVAHKKMTRRRTRGRKGRRKKKQTTARVEERERRFSIKYLRWCGGAEPPSLRQSVGPPSLHLLVFCSNLLPQMKYTDLILQKLLLSRDLCMCYDSGPDACYHHQHHLSTHSTQAPPPPSYTASSDALSAY